MNDNSQSPNNPKGFDLNTVIHIPGKLAGEPYHSLIRDFLSNLYQAGYSKSTIKSYGWHLHSWAKRLQETNVLKIEQIERQTLRNWGCEIREKYQPQTQKLAITAVKDFFKWMVDENLCTTDHSKVLTTPPIKHKPQRTLTQTEVDKLLDSCDCSIRGVRDAAIIAVMVDTGFRASEMCNLTLSNFSLTKFQVSVLCKGGDYGNGYFSKGSIAYLNAWLATRSQIESGEDHIFISVGGITPKEHLTSRGLRTILKKVGVKAGVEDVHPHALRRSFATLRIKKGQPTRSVQLLGRWKNLEVFERYTKALQDDEDFFRQSAEEYSPLGEP